MLPTLKTYRSQEGQPLQGQIPISYQFYTGNGGGASPFIYDGSDVLVVTSELAAGPLTVSMRGTTASQCLVCLMTSISNTLTFDIGELIVPGVQGRSIPGITLPVADGPLSLEFTWLEAGVAQMTLFPSAAPSGLVPGLQDQIMVTDAGSAVWSNSINVLGNLRLAGVSGVGGQVLRKTSATTQTWQKLQTGDIQPGTANQVLVMNGPGTAAVWASTIRPQQVIATVSVDAPALVSGAGLFANGPAFFADFANFDGEMQLSSSAGDAGNPMVSLGPGLAPQWNTIRAASNSFVRTIKAQDLNATAGPTYILFNGPPFTDDALNNVTAFTVNGATTGIQQPNEEQFLLPGSFGDYEVDFTMPLYGTGVDNSQICITMELNGTELFYPALLSTLGPVGGLAFLSGKFPATYLPPAYPGTDVIMKFIARRKHGAGELSVHDDVSSLGATIKITLKNTLSTAGYQ